MLPDLFDLPRPARGRAASPWTEERLRHLRRRWKAGARAREIGAELGVSANAVIAKIHRLGIARLSPYGGAPGRRLALRRIPAADRPRRARRRAFSLRRAPPAAVLLKTKRLVENARRDEEIPRSQRRALFELSDTKLQMAGRRSALAVVLLLRGGGDAQQALLRRALYAGLSAPAGGASRAVRSRASGNPGVKDCSPWAPACAGANGVSR